MKTENSKVLATAISQELTLAESLVESGDLNLAFHHLERAHVLGQASTYQHTCIHWRMFKLAVRQRSPREIWGTDRSAYRSLDQNAFRHLSNRQHGRS
ncbi:MAG: DUF3703 domain-containing protein [Acidobacteria bacterium]|nr:DUF3703 domain-containing protein [Acidobacteriota bacterium]